MASNFPGINISDVLDNEKLQEIFGCSPQGGMRRAHKTNSLVLVSDHVKSVYGDRWIDDILHYTGMGLKGDQSLDFSQNRTLNESNTNGIYIHLFEVYAKGEYTYLGQVVLAGSAYQETQPDQDGKLRDVWVFPLRLSQGKPLVRSEGEFRQEQERKAKKTRRLSDKELTERAGNSRKKPGSRNTQSTQYDRDPYVAELARRRANGICDLCERHAPFKKKNGDPYLETHHIVWLSKGGDDTTENTVALCPNCHRQMHIVDSEYDKKALLDKASVPS